MLELFRPNQHFAALEDVDLETLAAAGIEGLLIDRDKTLTAWRSQDVSEPKRRWFEAAVKRFRICIISNTIFIRGVAALGERLGVPAVCRWGAGRKPLPGGIRAALAAIDVQPQHAALIGDQLMTDMLGGNLLGLHTILVEPASGSEFFGTRLTRILEGMIARRLRLVPETSGEEE